ncbi:MAG: hypothetical protein JST11_07240 [Acidobacteria bacterium]|nr:hypothetical protein [Acidobacteriota bacterium]
MAADPTDEQLVRYLLHELPDAERRTIQESLFADPALLDRMQDAENDLIDALVRGELAEPEAAKVREFVTATGQQARVRFARALADAAAGGAGQAAAVRDGRLRSRWFSPIAALAFACVVLAVATTGLWMRNRSPRAPAVSGRVATPGGSVFAFAVRAGAVRGGEGPVRVRLPSGTSVARIDLALEGGADYTKFSVALATAAGGPVWGQSGALVKGADRVSLLVPANVLAPGAYEAALSGGSGNGPLKIVDYYYFRVE